MTLCRFVNKWRVFQCPLQVKLKIVEKVFMCEARLHNFCTKGQVLRLPGDATFEEEECTEMDIPSDSLQPVEGTFMMREILVDKIYQSGFSRPAAN